MAGLDVDLIQRIPLVDKKVRPSDTGKRRERHGEEAREDRRRHLPVRKSEDQESAERRTVDITV